LVNFNFTSLKLALSQKLFSENRSVSTLLSELNEGKLEAEQLWLIVDNGYKLAQLNEARAVIEQKIMQLMGKVIKLNIRLSEDKKESPKTNSVTNLIKDVFGGELVDEF
jgi:predicted nuclease with TOPRIM domain